MRREKKDPEFQAWLDEVDKICMQQLTVSLHDLGDMMTRDAFDSGTSPQDFFDETVVQNVREEFGDSMIEDLLGDEPEDKEE